MALTVTTDLTVITTAETATGWTTYGAGGSGALALEPDFFAQGSNCISRGVSGAATNKGMCFDIGAGNVLNFTTTHAGKLIYIWMRCNTPTLADTRENGGIRIVIGSGTTAPADAAGVWSAWYVDGSNTIATEQGWKCYVIDPTLTPSTTFGVGLDLAALRWFGGVMRSTATAKGQNFGIDQISYGFGELRCRGTNTTTGAGFAEMNAADYGTATNRYGILTEREGIFYVNGKLILGDGISTNSTDFTSFNESVVWERRTYNSAVGNRSCYNDFIGATATNYHGLDIRGNNTGNTNVTFGVKVGTGDTASGRSGPIFIGDRTPVSFNFDDGYVENVLIYGSTFKQIRNGINMGANASSDEFIGNVITGCGSFQAGPAVVRNCNFIENLGGNNRIFEDFILFSTGTSILKRWLVVLNGSNLSFAGGGYVSLLDPGASDRREVYRVDPAPALTSGDHYAEAIINWPSDGANQGSIGVFIRQSSTLTTENYYYLKCDLLNSQITLIRCDAGTDTAIAGPTTFVFAEDTDYLVHLNGRSTVIEGFINGTKISATGQSSYTSNVHVGIRGDAEADQTGSGPRLSKFGAGLLSDKLGAIVLSSSNDNFGYSNFINNMRATDLLTTGTYSSVNNNFVGNLVDIRDDSSGATTVNVTGTGGAPLLTKTEEVDDAVTTISASVTLNITIKKPDGTALENARVAIFTDNSGEVELMNELTNASGLASETYAYSGEQTIFIRIRAASGSPAYKDVEANGTITAAGFTLEATLEIDPNVV